MNPIIIGILIGAFIYLIIFLFADISKKYVKDPEKAYKSKRSYRDYINKHYSYFSYIQKCIDTRFSEGSIEESLKVAAKNNSDLIAKIYIADKSGNDFSKTLGK